MPGRGPIATPSLIGWDGWAPRLVVAIVLAAHLGSPPVGVAGPFPSPRAESGCEDTPVEDTESPGLDAGDDEVAPLHVARRRPSRRAGAARDRTPGFFWPRTIPTARALRPSHATHGPMAGHFLAEGRPLRDWIQSRTF